MTQAQIKTNIEKDFVHFPPSKYKKLQDKLTSEFYTATLDEIQRDVSGKYDKETSTRKKMPSLTEKQNYRI